jgi:hypothetical protein
MNSTGRRSRANAHARVSSNLRQKSEFNFSVSPHQRRHLAKDAASAGYFFYDLALAKGKEDIVGRNFIPGYSERRAEDQPYHGSETGLCGSAFVLTETGATRSSNVSASINQVIGPNIYQYRRTKSATWSGKVANAGTAAVNETKSFGSCSVQVQMSSSKYGSFHGSRRFRLMSSVPYES